jgi:hypothetical protein
MVGPEIYRVGTIRPPLPEDGEKGIPEVGVLVAGNDKYGDISHNGVQRRFGII